MAMLAAAAICGLPSLNKTRTGTSGGLEWRGEGAMWLRAGLFKTI